MNPIMSLGIILLSGFIAANLIRRCKMPSITAYLLIGIILGPSVLKLISKEIISQSSLISNIVLSFIAFSIGQNFSKERFKEIGKTAVIISFAEGLLASIFVGLGLYFLTDLSFFVVLAFAAIAPATAPAAVVMIVREFKAKGRFTDTLLAVVALDDSWGLMIFAILLAVAKSYVGVQGDEGLLSGVMTGILEIIGAMVLGTLLAFVLGYFSKFLKTAKQFQIYTLGFIILNSGLSLHLGVSLLLSNMIMAAVITNMKLHSHNFFNVIREIDSPFYLIFFVLAGANLEIGLLASMGFVGLLYIFLRMFGKITGVYIASIISSAPPKIRKFLGIGLAPQAGVALGMAMIVKGLFPSEGAFVMSIIIATTVVYEIVGPLFTKIALKAAGEIEK